MPFELTNLADQELVAQDEHDFETSRDALLYVIDASESMLEACNELDGKNCTQVALESALDAITKKVTAAPLDMAGVILYGTQHSTDRDYPNCTMVMELGMPDSAKLKHLKRLITDSEFFQETCGTPTEAILSNVLFLSMRQFEQNCKVKATKRIVFVTDNDNPHKDDAQKKLSAKTRASDLVEKSIFIEPTFISHSGRSFDTSIYYDDLALGTDPYGEAGTEDLYMPKPVSALVLKKSIIESRHLKRPLYSVPLELPNNIIIGTKGYLLYKKRDVVSQKKKVFTDAEVPKMVKIKSRAIVEATGRELKLADLKRTFTFGGQTVNFSPEKLRELKSFGDPVIRIIGFKPANAIKDWLNITHSTFIYPSDDKIEGSIRAFSALYQTLRKMQKVAIAWCIMRKNDAPRLNALMPSPGSHEEVPQGLQMVPLPFADDIRKKPSKMYLEPTPDLIDHAKDIIHSLTMPKGYEPERYSNPSLDWSFKVLESLALDEELGEPSKDSTLPKYRSIKSRAGKSISEWNGILNKVAPFVPTEELPKKRGEPKAISDKPAKKQKFGTSYEEFVSAHKQNLLSNYSVKELNAFAKEHNIKNPGSTKDFIVASVSRFLDAKQD